jgi:hypothetical protein
MLYRVRMSGIDNRVLPSALSVMTMLLMMATWLACGSRPAVRAPDPDLVVAHSAGIVSRYDDISVVLGTGRNPQQLAGLNPFSFDPPLKGSISWSADGRRVNFRPEAGLKSGTVYRVVFDFAAIGEAGNGWFSFMVRGSAPGFSVSAGTLYADRDGALVLEGLVRSDGIAVPSGIEAAVTATLAGRRLAMVWQHDGGGVHRFSVQDIPRGTTAAELLLAWDGRKLGSQERGSERIRIPAEGVFEVLSVTGPGYRISGSGDSAASAITIAFSAPVDPAQDFRGLIRAGDATIGTAAWYDGSAANPLRFEASGGIVRMYSALRWPDTVAVSIERGLRSRSLASIATPVNAQVRFDWQLPEVRFAPGGVIVPTSQGTRVVLETRNLANVVVEALRVHGDNLLQFMQVNELAGSQELRRVGEVVWRQELDLAWSDDQKNQWIRHALDLEPLIGQHPDGLFQLRVTFGREHVRFVSPNEHRDLGKWTFPVITISDEGDGASYWDYYDEWFDWETYYRYRDDPTHPAFYIPGYDRDRVARRNVLVSDIGILAKRDVDALWHVALTDLRTARPLPGAVIRMYSFAMRELASAVAGSDGTATIKPGQVGSRGEPAGSRGEPAFIVVEAPGATSGRDRGYLKLSGANTLSVSHFDVGGEQADSGLKGFIYGERGVWRPGDEMHLTFVLYDRLGSLPADHPIHFELENPLGQIVRQGSYGNPVNGFYHIQTATEATSPTGTWTARVRIGGRTFSRPLKVEMIMPNRLRLALDLGDQAYASADMTKLGLSAAWLHGAPAPGLKADVVMQLLSSGKAPGGFDAYSFNDPLRTIPSGRELLFDGVLDGQGRADFPVRLWPDSEAPGPLRASFSSRVFERSGLFSSELFTVDFHPYKRYVGIRVPAGDAARNMLLTDTDHRVELLLVDRNGQPVKNGRIDVAVYKLEWRWWWEKSAESLAELASDIYARSVYAERVDIRDGRATFKLRINHPDWGRYLVRAVDTAGGHAAGSVFYIDWPGWAGRSTGDGSGSAAMLSLSSDRDSYAVGSPVRVSFPSNAAGRARVDIERAGRIIASQWLETSDGTTIHEFLAMADMVPNVYVHVSFLQAHLQTVNDLPIRLYGVLPVMIEDPATRLAPVITVPETLAPGSTTSFTVSEKRGKAMTYTVAVVDEGLLGITRHATPELWSVFYRKEASQLAAFDLFKDVAGAWTGQLQTLLAIGGSESDELIGERRVSRFPPVVHYLGPFTLETGQQASHTLELGNYIGAVRFMVVAGTPDGAFGHAELTRPVRTDLMAFITAPRVLGPSETLSIPVTVFGFLGKPARVRVALAVQGDASLTGPRQQTIAFEADGEQTVFFELATAARTGAVRLVATATGPDGQSSTQTVQLPIRPSTVPVTSLTGTLLAAGSKAALSLELPGLAGSNEAWLELSLLPPVDLSGRLAWLLGYPHGCAEQLTSQAFPQLFLAEAMNLTAGQIQDARANVAAAIARLVEFQTDRGGFVVWPGAYDEQAWLSAYVSHFLVMARKQGFTVPDVLLSSALGYLRTQSQVWNAQSDPAKAEQAYRLYVLALAGQADIAAMNRFNEFRPLPTAAAYHLAAAYAYAGMPGRAQDLIDAADVDIQPYQGMAQVYGSLLRDRAILLDVLNALGDTARGLPLFRMIAQDLSSTAGHSTQSLSYALIAALPYMRAAAAGATMVDYAGKGASGRVMVGKGLAVVPLDVDAGSISLALSNVGASAVHARLVARGTPAPGQEKTRSAGLVLTARYQDAAGSAVDPARVALGSDLIVELAVRNNSGEALDDIALTFQAPAGWEIANLRLGQSAEGSADLAPDVYDYQDIRDDRVMTYFGLDHAETRRFRFFVNKTYDGDFFMPAIVAEAMYRPDVFAVLPGRLLPRAAPRD